MKHTLVSMNLSIVLYLSSRLLPMYLSIMCCICPAIQRLCIYQLDCICLAIQLFKWPYLDHLSVCCLPTSQQRLAGGSESSSTRPMDCHAICNPKQVPNKIDSSHRYRPTSIRLTRYCSAQERICLLIKSHNHLSKTLDSMAFSQDDLLQSLNFTSKTLNNLFLPYSKNINRNRWIYKTPLNSRCIT